MPGLIHRRGFLGSLAAAFAAPAIVRVDSLMALRGALFNAVSLCNLVQYEGGADQHIDRLDFLFGAMHVRGPWLVFLPDDKILFGDRVITCQ